MKGYDEYNTILLPPRAHGEKLPPELLEYYDEQLRKMEEAEKAKREAEEAEELARREAEEGNSDLVLPDIVKWTCHILTLGKFIVDLRVIRIKITL